MTTTILGQHRESQKWNSVLIALSITLLAAASLPSHAQAGIQPGATPQEVSKALHDATRACDFQTVAGLMHPEAMQSFRNTALRLIEMDTSGQALAMLFGSKSHEEVQGLPPQDVFASFLTGLTSALPPLKQAMASATCDTIGTLIEGELVHVVNRMHMNVSGASTSKVDVLTLKRDGEEWRALLTTDMDQLVQRMFGGR